MLRLNLGSGTNKVDGYVNVDRAHGPDVVHDLETFPWPWPTSSVEEIRAHHILEHLGATPAVFIGVVKEMHRVCAPGATVDILVPHPRCDNFLNDPTHVRPITLETMKMFSKRMNAEWAAAGWANSHLALEHDVDFEPKRCALQLAPGVQEKYRDALDDAIRERNNIVIEIRIILECVK